MQVKVIYIVFLLLFSLGNYAQDKSVLVIKPKTKNQEVEGQKRRGNDNKINKELLLHTITLGFLHNELKEKDYRDLKSYFGISASYDELLLFNSTQSVFNYGLDMNYIYLNYINYRLRFHNSGNIETSQWHQAEAGIQVGLALLIAPIQNFNIKIYARYAPTFSAINAYEKWNTSYGSYIVAGLAINIGPVGIGGDFRYGTCKYKEFSHTGDFTNMGGHLYASINF